MLHLHRRQIAFALLVDNLSLANQNPLRTCFARISRFKDFVQLFQSPAFRLHEEAVNEQELKAVPKDKEDVEPIPDVLQSHGSRECVHKGGKTGCDLEQEHPFGSHLVRHDFGRVDGLHACIGESESDSKDVDEGDAGLGGCLGPSINVARRSPRCDGETDDHAECRAKHHLSSADDVVEPSTCRRRDPSGQRVDCVEQEDRVGVRDPNVGE